MDENTPTTLKRDWKPVVKKVLIWGGVITGTALVTYFLTKTGDDAADACPFENGEDVLELDTVA